MLNKPLEFQLEELVAQFGFVEIIHQLARIMYKSTKYQHLVGDMEKIRDAIGKSQ